MDDAALLQLEEAVGGAVVEDFPAAGEPGGEAGEPRLVSDDRETIDADWGIRPAPLDVLAGLRPVNADGVTSYGSQTHPADGCAGMLVTSARSEAQILSSGFARVARGEMPKAPVPAAATTPATHRRADAPTRQSATTRHTVRPAAR